MKRVMLTLAASAFLAGALAETAPAQNYPAQPIRMIISFGPGGGSDVIGRIIAQRMQEKLGQPVVVENRPGAGGTIGNALIANSNKDGYTLGIMTAGQIIAPVMSKSPPYDTLKVFDSAGQIATAGLLIVTRNDSPFKDIKSLVAAAKANPGKLNFASPGYGATQHMAAELFKQVAGIDAQQVQFRTSGEALAALLSKQVDVLFDTITALLGQVQGGQVHPLAVTGKDRFPATPNIPAAIESGVTPNFDVTTWYGLFGPRGMPKPVVARLNATLNEILQEAPVRERLTKAGVVVRGSTPEAFDKFMAEEFAKWTKVRIAAKLEQR
ncbi:MAG: tripartite tricarboxylate transporter substrate binding protein [Alphaproteobacteria bacterium]|nr:tripartite tricarboxylate transporter substrate binding protein [Alphaproteobacteria bacterium]